jgi:ribosomal protein L11 methyltransferase
MPFLQLTLELGSRDPTPFEEALFELGALSVTLEDAADNPVLEPAPGMTPLWPAVRLRALFEHDIATDGLLAAMESSSLDWPEAHFDALADRIWEREWLKDFQPRRCGHRLWVSPTHLTPDEPNAVVVHLDPGLAFGTGTHPTTALCLEWLDGTTLEGRQVIDYGCGSGILSIAALKLGAAHAIAVDNDPQALLATTDNAERNQVSERLSVQAVGGPLAPADVLVANILAEPLIELAPYLASLVVPNGMIILSGILSSQAQAVRDHYDAWFELDASVHREDWVLLAGKRRFPSSPAAPV